MGGAEGGPGQGSLRATTRVGYRSVWSPACANNKILVTQTVELVPGDQSRVLDTCLVRYKIENQDTVPHKVGLRFMLDTYIGANDGVPYTIPGLSGLCDTSKDMPTEAPIPDFIQALERDDLKNPGTIAQLRLHMGGNYDRPTGSPWERGRTLGSPECRSFRPAPRRRAAT